MPPAGWDTDRMTPATNRHVRLPASRDAHDVRLVVADLDGTLLDPDHRPDPSLWPLLEELDRRGVTFCPASGRQYASILKQLGAAGDSLVVVAENGAYVARAGAELVSDPIDGTAVVSAVRALRAEEKAGTALGIVLAGRRAAYIERSDDDFLATVRTYYERIQVVGDLLEAPEEILKVAVFDASYTGTSVRALEHLRATHQVVVSGAHWVDVMNRHAHKGTAVRRLQTSLGIGPEHTMAFGDYLNDLQMLDTAELSFAMANAHPDVLARARYIAPPNTDNGVVRTVATVFGIDLPGVAPVSA